MDTQLSLLEQYELDPIPMDSDCWGTPEWLLDAARSVIGPFALDPCTWPSNPTKAGTYYTQLQDGLCHPWRGPTWLNPPYSNPAPWMHRLVEHYKSGKVRAAIALCKEGILHNKKTATEIATNATAVCLFKGRIAFVLPPGMERKTNGNEFDTVAIYFGDDLTTFKKEFSQYGSIYIPI